MHAMTKNTCNRQGLRQFRGGAMSKNDQQISGKKDGQLVLRLDKGERDAFVDLCKELDTSAAREIRHFIRRFMKENARQSEQV